MSEKNVADIVQEILNRNNKPFMTLKTLAQKLGTDIKHETGIKSNATTSQIKMYLEPMLEDRFIFKKKGNSVYIIKPCEPSEFLTSALSTTTAKSPKVVARSLSFLSKKEFAEILNDLVKQGNVQSVYTDDLEPRLLLVVNAAPKPKAITKAKADNREYTLEEFHRAYNVLHKKRLFVRIPDLRRALNWPREVFDEMVRNLRDRRIIQLHIEEASFMTVDELENCFVDKNNFRMGSVSWNDR